MPLELGGVVVQSRKIDVRNRTGIGPRIYGALPLNLKNNFIIMRLNGGCKSAGNKSKY